MGFVILSKGLGKWWRSGESGIELGLNNCIAKFIDVEDRCLEKEHLEIICHDSPVWVFDPL